MMNADTIYPIIAVIFYLLLLFRATSKQIRQYILEWWNRLVEIILPVIWQVISSRWFLIPALAVGLVLIGGFFLLNMAGFGQTASISEDPTFSYTIAPDESFLTTKFPDYPVLREDFKKKIIRKFASKIARTAKANDYTGIQIVTYRDDQMMDFGLLIEYGNVEISERIQFALYHEEGLDTLISNWIPMDIAMPIIPTGGSFPFDGREGMRVEFRLFNLIRPEPETPPQICLYKGLESNDQVFYIELDDNHFCQRKITSHTPVNPEKDSEYDEDELIVGQLDICLDGAGNIQQMEISVEENPDDLATEEEIRAKVELIAKSVKFSNSAERWQCGKIWLSFHAL